MKMNYTDALTLAIDTLSAMDKTEETSKAIDRLTALRTTYANRAEKRPQMSEEKKAELSAKRKAETAAKRAEVMAVVLPVLRANLTPDMTAKQLFEASAPELPADWNDKKVQYVLLHEMKSEVTVRQVKGEPNYYTLIK